MENYQTHKLDQMVELSKQIIPGAVMSNFRKSLGDRPLYMSHGKGARLYDVDGNEYIDYSLGSGSVILGHSNEHLQQAIENQVKRLHTTTANDLELKAAQKVVAHVPSAEMIRFACSGTEANYCAQRVARAYTNKNMVVRFEGHYHGGLDDLMGGIVTDPENPIPVSADREDDFYSQIAHTAGRARHAFDDCFMVEWNNLPVLENLFSRYGDNIAALLMEPVMVNLFGCFPEPGYLEGVRELCDKHNVGLIFDEMLTGFRMGLKGAQGYFGVTPDITTLGKALGGGVAVSAFCGKREIMDWIARTEVVAGGTYNGNPLAMAAVIATIEELEKDDGAAYGHIEKLGNMLKEGLNEIAGAHKQDLLLQGFPGAWTFSFSSKRKIINHKEGLSVDMLKVVQFSKLLMKAGILNMIRFCTSTAHTEKDVEEVLSRTDDVMKQL
ncbi:MAG: aspartate aminotransferase family protein [Deltaproteobacteria bacterium]|nr:aspartate aminotransferase family protein [Deltaproteobacteria bacterium]